MDIKLSISMRPLWSTLCSMALLCLLQGAHANPSPLTSPSELQHLSLLHLPGIAGELSIDRNMLQGLEAGGYRGRTKIYDWTGTLAGLGALLNRQHNDQEAQKIADAIADALRRDPELRIIVTSHSGGTGLAVWALEKLPADAKVQSLFLLSSALSPTYDLSNALRHVRGHAYAFTSENDQIILDMGTKSFGTIDGKKVAAGGCVGFQAPETADQKQYAKLVQQPYDKHWLALGNDGDHIGSLAPRFARDVLAPLVLKDAGVALSFDAAPPDSAPTSAPASQPAP